jgi:hypothetical protein
MFLNYMMLFGLIAVAIPILIHLLNRRRARTVEWGAMQFLLASLASRNRRILIEEIALMALRCLALALLVAALARPFLPTRRGLSWAVALPALPAAAVLVGIAASAWAYRRVRWGLLAAAGALLAAAGAAVAVEHARQQEQWAGRGAADKDVAVVIDASLSMTLRAGEAANFRRAIDEARAVVGACRPADAVCVILAGPTPRPVVPAPLSDRDEVLAKLASLEPAGGSMRVLPALNAAAAALAKGHNPGKRIVLITDGQGVGWRPDSPARWAFLSAVLDDLPTRPEVVCRRLGVPETLRNVAVAEVSLSRKIVGTDRPAKVHVKLTNTGTCPIRPRRIELRLDGVEISRRNVPPIAPRAAQVVTFDHRFHTHGWKVLTAAVVADDDLPADDTAHHAVCVARTLPVLIVDGGGAAGAGASAYIELALAPPPGLADPCRPWPGHRADAPSPRPLFSPRVVRLRELADETDPDLGGCRVVVLANVPLLPKAFAARLTEFVRKGGGLLIAAGDRGQPRFYNHWTEPTGAAVAPAALRQRLAADPPVRLDLESFSHPVLAEKIAVPGNWDAGRALVTSYWRLEPPRADPAVRLGGRFDSGHPFLVERQLGKGFVLMTAVALGRRDSDLAGRECFVPLVQEMVQFLAEPLAASANVRPGVEVSLPLPPRAAGGRFAPGEAIDVATPTGRAGRGLVVAVGGGTRARFAGTHRPGLYRFVLDPAAAPAARTAPAPGGGLPFVVVADPAESTLQPLDDDDLRRIGRHVKLAHADTTDELTSFIAGGVPGREIWRLLAVCAAIALIGEIAVTRWIAIRRKAHAIQTVSFGTEAVDARLWRQRAKELVAVTAEAPKAPAGTRPAGREAVTP